MFLFIEVMTVQLAGANGQPPPGRM